MLIEIHSGQFSGTTAYQRKIISCQYKGSVCRVIHRGVLIEVSTDTRQGCMLSPFLFRLVIKWITKQVS